MSADTKQAQAVVDAFNAAHPVGTPVRYWPGFRKGDGQPSTTRTAAWVLSGVMPVVCVDGYASAVALTHVDPTGEVAR